MSDLLTVALMAWRNYSAVNPPRTLLTATIPRAVVQVCFFMLLGRELGGPGTIGAALLGASAYVITRATVINVTTAVAVDITYGTLDGLFLGRRGLPAIVLARCWVWVAEGVVSAIAAFLLVGPAVLGGRWTMQHLPAVGLFVLAGLTTVPLGLIVAALGLLRRVEVLVSNIVTYALLVGCAVVTAGPTGPARLGEFLPLTNVVNALRSEDPWPLAGREALTGAAWLVVAVATLHLVQRHLRKTGTSA